MSIVKQECFLNSKEIRRHENTGDVQPPQRKVLSLWLPKVWVPAILWWEKRIKLEIEKLIEWEE
jgi:hypothetical protein